MIENLIKMLKNDLRIAIIAVLMFVLYHLSIYLKTFIDKEGIEKTKCEEKLERLEKQNDSANILIIELLKLNQMRHDSIK
jgi:hypothetical protein